ncbi:DUF3570 domain-containing protein [Aequorivita antarctica]|uniref:DUF3570 domain-containing protein n=1 Tax=Aequorivita antarctica TaxID=153266 RepID=A0A5C6YXI0_9FLAO|nr:DUF3570 domain-containing protein [Aequorivita antarctica]TXD72305.1 DUF3570 domain-containing protein [Aequorivita antarctica]SRX74441.1 hypothetical protein AEQU3_01420 [Aequorivita antarctica]
MKYTISLFIILFSATVFAQDSTSTYKKRVLEASEVDFLTSFYSQDGNNAAVSGGIGSEKLTDFTPTIVVAIPLNDDDVLTIDAGVSAYTSASSSNIDPFDGNSPADPYVSSSGASASDLWAGGNFSYSHRSDDRNDIVSAKVSVSSEFDYFSFGFGGNYTKLFNEKNTELSVHANVYLDTWKLLYPIELRQSSTFNGLDKKNRNSYSIGFGFSQILSKSLQGSLSLDLVQQQGLLSTPFQRVYFSDLPDRFRENFQLADDIERLPDTRFKTAIGGRLNYFINEMFVVRTYYRYYSDDWGINSHTASIEVPIKITDKFTLYPSYRFYNQTAADYFYPYEVALSTDEFYTSDYDLSKFSANQYGFGIGYTDIFTKFRLLKFGLKSIDLKYDYYKRDSGLNYSLISAGFKFIGN